MLVTGNLTIKHGGVTVNKGDITIKRGDWTIKKLFKHEKMNIKYRCFTIKHGKA